jgi:hypothetical protein
VFRACFTYFQTTESNEMAVSYSVGRPALKNVDEVLTVFVTGGEQTEKPVFLRI